MNTAETVEDGEGAPDLVAHSIHRGIYRHRTDVNAVMHSHARYSTALSVLEVDRIHIYIFGGLFALYGGLFAIYGG